MPTPSRPWFRRLLTFAMAFLAVYSGVLIWFFLTQAQRLYFPPLPSPVPFDFTLQRPDGIPLGGWEAPGPNREAALVVFGGNAMPVAPWRSRQGLAGCTDRALILVPYRGYEGNPGQTREEALIADGQAVVAWAKSRYPNVGVLGISLGSGVATAVAEREGKAVDLVALGTPYDRLDLVANDLLPWVFPRLLMRDSYASVDRIAQVQAPVFVLRADRDPLIRAPRTAALIKASGGQAVETVAPGGHDDVWRTPEACAWLRQVTRRPAPPEG